MTYAAITTRTLRTIGDAPGLIEVTDGNGSRPPFFYTRTPEDRQLGLVEQHRSAVRAFLGGAAYTADHYMPGYLYTRPDADAMSTFVWVLPSERYQLSPTHHPSITASGRW